MSAQVSGPVLSVRRYEAHPPPNMELQVDTGDVVATTKEEEWVTKKKTELTTTRQIETRVKRQVVLEDGHVVEDSGPVVTTNTTEDTQKQEQETKEHRTLDGDPPGEDWVAVPGPGGALVKEVTERTVKTREEVQDRVETEDVQQLGDISDEAYLGAITRGEDLRQAVGRELVPRTPRVVHQSRKAKRTHDTADCTAISELQADGRVVTETRRTTEHEEECDDEEPDSDVGSHSDHQETRKENSQRFAKTKDQDLVEYLANGVKIGEEMRYTAENMEGDCEGDPIDIPAHQAWDTLSSRVRRMRRQVNKASREVPAAGAPVPLDRKDALTKKPLDFDQEEETRKVETSKWLEHHFGSDSRSSKDSIEDDDIPAAGRNTSFINVTMKSRPITNMVVSPVNSTTRVGATSSTQVNGTTVFPMSLNSRPNSQFQISSSKRHEAVFSPINSKSSFPRMSSPGNEDSVSPSYVVNTRSSGFSSPIQGFSRSNGISSPNEVVKPLNICSPVNGFSTTPKSFVATVNSSSRVFVSSPESEGVPSNDAKGYFQGVSEWSERRNEHQVQETRQTFTPPPVIVPLHPDRVQVLPSGPSHVFALKSQAASPYTSISPSDSKGLHYSNSKTSPYPSGNFQPSEYRIEQQRDRTSPYLVQNHIGSQRDQNPTSHNLGSQHDFNSRYEVFQNSHMSSTRPEQKTSPHPQRDSSFALGDHTISSTYAIASSPALLKQINGWTEHEEDGYRGYHKGAPHKEPDPDYSPPTAARKDSPDRDSPQSSANKKLYQRTRFAADIPPPPSHPTTRSKSPGNFIGDSFRKLVGKFRSSSSERKNKRAAKASKNSPRASSRSPSPQQTSPTYQQFHVIDNNIPYAGGVGVGLDGGRGGEDEEQPVAPPRVSRSNSQKHQDLMESRGGPVMQRYYLGEDPFGGSIYGREKEYDGVIKRRSHHRQNGHRRGSHEEDDMNKANISHVVTSSSTLSRVSKSSNQDLGGIHDYTRTSQTLPRKLRHEERHSTSLTANPNSINVSIVNNVTPAKPARTYRSNLSRSQSFNVQSAGVPRSGMYTSNPALNRIGESPAPLKSPAILASISRSQRDLTSEVLEEDDVPRFSRSTNNLLADSPLNPKKQMFMQGLADRAPELFKTLHGDEVRIDSKSPGHKYTSTPVRTTHIVETTHSSKTTPLRNSYASYNASTPMRNGLIADSMHSNGSASPTRNERMVETSYSNSTSAAPLRNVRSSGMRNGCIMESSNSFRSSSTNESDPVKHLSSPYRTAANVDRVTSPSLYASSALVGDRVQSPSSGFRNNISSQGPDGNTTSRSVVRRGSGDDYSETVHIKSKNDDPIRPSETNTIQSFSKKTVPLRGGSGRATEVVESSERTTVTKSRFRGGGLESPSPALGSGTGYTSRNGGVVIEVRPDRK